VILAPLGASPMIILLVNYVLMEVTLPQMELYHVKNVDVVEKRILIILSVLYAQQENIQQIMDNVKHAHIINTVKTLEPVLVVPAPLDLKSMLVELIVNYVYQELIHWVVMLVKYALLVKSPLFQVLLPVSHVNVDPPPMLSLLDVCYVQQERIPQKEVLANNAQ